MGLLGVLKSLDVDKLSDKEKAALKDALRKHKTTLKEVSRLVDGHLKKLAKKKKRKAGKRS